MAAYDRPCPAIDGYDRLCPVMAGYERPCPVMAGYDRSWLIELKCLVMAGYDRSWPFFFWLGMASYGWSLPAISSHDWTNLVISTAITGQKSPRVCPVMAGHGWSYLDLAVWEIMDSVSHFYVFWSDLASHGRSNLNKWTGRGWSWLAMTSSGWSWLCEIQQWPAKSGHDHAKSSHDQPWLGMAGHVQVSQLVAHLQFSHVRSTFL